MTSSPESITKRAYPRAGLLGNPSDGYGGKTISFAFSDYAASVTLTPQDELEICAPLKDRFRSVHDLDQHITHHGYYGADRILKAAIRRFYWYCRETQQPLHQENFKLTWESDIPRQVGLAGSSAIITATLEALFAWFDTSIPQHIFPALTLSVESELGIQAGFQDRVIQAYRGLVYMDFADEKMQSENGLGYGEYERLPVEKLTNVFVSFAHAGGEPTEVFHNNIAQRFRDGDQDVRDAMNCFAQLAEKGRDEILAGNMDSLSRLVDQNFDQRQAICQLPQPHVQMIEAARSAGCSAKFCGSGGAIVGIFPDDEAFALAVDQLHQLNCVTFKPQIVE